MADIWYYAEKGSSVGPFSKSELIETLSQVREAENVLVWRNGITDWRKASEFSDLLPHLVRPPPVPVPPPLPERKVSGVAQPIVRADDRLIPQQVDKVSQEPVGIGGWLGLLALGQVFGPLKLLVSLSNYYGSLDASIWVNYPLTAYGEAALNASMLLLSVWTTVLFFKKSRQFPKFFIWECVLSVLFLPIDTLLVVPIVQSFDKAISLVTPKDVGPWVGVIISAVIWVPYIKKSKRVGRTFVN